MKIALRVDVDTFRGTRKGVPELLRILDKYELRAAFFFSAGPDNMGRHLWRLLKPQFLWKMLRTRAASLYGPEIIFMGTMWPGPQIARRNPDVLRSCAAAGHEIGLHAWDHHYWQAHIDDMPETVIQQHLTQAYNTLSDITGTPPSCSAVPGWRGSESALLAKEKFSFRYNSDCRGTSVFMPVVNGIRLATPQIPLTMPTYDELLGRDGVTDENYNERILSFAREGALNLLTIHAEVEGGICAPLFEAFIQMARSRGVEFIAPGELLPPDSADIPSGKIVTGTVPGREGTLSLQSAV